MKERADATTLDNAKPPDQFWWRSRTRCTAPTPKPGDLCPACGKGTLAYDTLFVLTCPICGQTAESGAFT